MCVNMVNQKLTLARFASHTIGKHNVVVDEQVNHFHSSTYVVSAKKIYMFIRHKWSESDDEATKKFIQRF